MARDAGIHDALLATLPRLVTPAAGQTVLMSALNPEPWSHTRRWVSIALVLGAQIGLIFAFGDRKPVTPRQPGSIPELRLAEDRNRTA